MTKPKPRCIRHDRVADYPDGSCVLCAEEDRAREYEAKRAKKMGERAKSDKALADKRRVNFECAVAIMRDFGNEYPTLLADCEKIIGAMFIRWGGK